MKYIKSVFILLAIGMTTQLLFPHPLAAQSESSQKQLWQIRSMDLAISDRGFVVGGTWRHAWNRNWSSPAQFSFLFFRESDKIPYYDYYTYTYYEPPSKKIVFFNLRTGIQHRLWAESLAENMQPYLTISGGPTIALDPANDGGFFKRWRQTTFNYTASLFVGGGVDFIHSREGQFTFFAGYELMYFPETVDGSNNYSGVVVGFSFGERLH